ncbi:MAG: sulfatase [Pirellulaceae bacterium]|nr:MAG: sulfatase [Pirellulaceae bacterium]
MLAPWHSGWEQEWQRLVTRRYFFGKTATGIGTVALAGLLNPELWAGAARSVPGVLAQLHHRPRAKHVIYLFMSGGPSHIDLFDYKPQLQKYHGQELPASVRMGQRLTGMTAFQKSFPCVAPMFRFAQHGKCGTWVSELLPHIAGIVDDIAVVKSLHTEAINHDPAITYIQTGSQQPGRPSLGAWASYGLGTENADLPAFVVMISQGSGNKTDQPIFSRLWGSGFIPSQHQGVRLRSGKDPVLYLSDPPGMDRLSRRRMLDALEQLNRRTADAVGDPEIHTRIAQYEMAFRMQSSVPELTDLSDEPQYILDMYGIRDDNVDGGYARNCLLARRLVERGVRFVQLMHRGWDQHGNLPKQIRGQCSDVDRPTAALVQDLKARGLLDETLVLWGGEFGRTIYSQGPLTKDNYGRDHHGRCFTMWMAGGGIRPGIVYGETDDYCYNIVRDPVHIHDWNATILYCLGVDHTRLTFRFQGRDYRLTDVHGSVISGLLA